MDVLTEGWASFDDIPMVTSNGDNNFSHPSNQTSEMQNAEWDEFLSGLKQENSIGGSEPLFSNLTPETQAAPGALTSMSGSPLRTPYQTASLNNFSRITPPQSARQAGSSLPVTNVGATSYPASRLPGEQWRLVQMPHHPYTGSIGHEGLYIQMPPTPQTAGIHQGPVMEQMLLHDSPHGLPGVTMQDTDVVLYPADQNSTAFLDDSAGNDGDDEADAVDPCYAKLLYRALMEKHNHTMSLKELYEWIVVHSQKAKDSRSRGWQNSVRHNLSMNKVG